MSLVKRTLLIDCDGVLYPQSMLSIQQIVGPLRPVAEKFFGVNPELFSRAIDITKEKNQYGMFNLIMNLVDCDFERYHKFCTQLVDEIDFSGIKPDYDLYRTIQTASTKFNIFVATNNHKHQIERVSEARFGVKLEDACFKWIDITSTYKNGCFHPKHTPGALEVYAEVAGANPLDCTLIDDTPLNIEKAELIGMKGILASETFQLGQILDEEMSKL